MYRVLCVYKVKHTTKYICKIDENIDKSGIDLNCFKLTMKIG